MHELPVTITLFVLDVSQKTRLKSFLAIPGQGDAIRRSSVIGEQAGDVQKILNEVQVALEKNNVSATPELSEKLKVASSDLLIQLFLIGFQYGYDFDELFDLGLARLDEFKHTNYAGLEIRAE